MDEKEMEALRTFLEGGMPKDRGDVRSAGWMGPLLDSVEGIRADPNRAWQDIFADWAVRAWESGLRSRVEEELKRLAQP